MGLFVGICSICIRIYVHRSYIRICIRTSKCDLMFEHNTQASK